MSNQYENESDPEELDHEESDPEEGDSEDSNTSSDGDLWAKIFSTLKLIRTPSAFSYSAVDPFLPNPGLYLPPHGTLRLPLSTDDAENIILQASQSPFGRGEETLIDTTVRKSWELNPNQFSLKNPAWNEAIRKIVNSVAIEFGLEKEVEQISAELYKLLLYEPGAFFKPHKDSEKAPGMFATLVVCLPSPHEGGKLVLTHDNEKYEFETASSSDFNCSYAAWYSDITHEVQPVVSGYRLMLTYNLIRETGFWVPSHNLVRGHIKQLFTLLEQYNLRLEERDDKLPPILVHKFEHKYTEASLKLNMLKPPDLAQGQTLAQLSTKLGFHIYLATLELMINKDDEWPTYETNRSHTLENIVELDGKLVKKSIEYPKGALLDPMPQEESKVDEEEHEGPTGNEGAPSSYWYRDTVVVLVPPAKQFDFIFKFTYDGSIVEPLCCKLMQEFSQDLAQKPKLEQLCGLALQEPRDHFGSHHPIPAPIPSYIQRAAATALDLGRIDLFDKTCKALRDKILLDNASSLGRKAANNGVDTMINLLMKIIQIISCITKKVEFLKSVSEGFKTALPEPSLAERKSLKQWSDEIIFTAIGELTTLTKDDGISLAQLCQTVDWNQFGSKAKSIILKADIKTKMSFIKESMSTPQQEFDKEKRSFIESIIFNIWKEFVFDTECHEPVPQKTSYYWLESKSNLVHYNYLNDILHFVGNTVTSLSSECVETTIIPAMLRAIPATSKECVKAIFLSLVKMILKNELPGFRLLTNNAIPPPLHKRFLQALLTKYLLENVSDEPLAPANWSLPAGSCNCKDCSMVNRFLQNPVQQRLDFPCVEARHKHLTQTFRQSSYYSYSSTNVDDYDIATVSGCNPKIWRITKNRRKYQAAKSKWTENVKSVTETLLVLKEVEPVEGRLKAYLQPYYSIIMNASIKQLPDLKSLVTVPQLVMINVNVAHNQPTNQLGHKREASNTHPPGDELSKRTKL